MLDIIILFMKLVSIKEFNLPYLYPIIPFNTKDFLHLFIRKDIKKNKIN